MKKYRILLPLIFFTVLFSKPDITAQRGWQTGNYYASQGRSAIENAYQNEWNNYQGRYVRVRYCRQLNWYQEWHSGYVYYWQYNNYTGRYEWKSQWKEGTFWYCNWSAWYRC